MKDVRRTKRAIAREIARLRDDDGPGMVTVEIQRTVVNAEGEPSEEITRTFEVQITGGSR